MFLKATEEVGAENVPVSQEGEALGGGPSRLRRKLRRSRLMLWAAGEQMATVSVALWGSAVHVEEEQVG